jgi:hypothetical protein
MFDRWAAQEFSTDWGTRDLSPTVSFFDPISYHQGTVWPLYTGWVAVSEYRNGRSLSGYAHLMQNADLTWAQDPGAVTELLSGQFFAPLGRSTSHQLWSSAMVISPVLRGLFGLEWDAAANKLTVTPSLPAEWDRAALHHVPLAGGAVDLEMTRSGTMLWCAPWGRRSRAARFAHPGRKVFRRSSAHTPARGGGWHLPCSPQPGATTQQMKVLDQQSTANSLTLRLCGTRPTVTRPSCSASTICMQNFVSTGAEAPQENKSSLRPLQLDFPPGEGYVEKTWKITW